MNRFATGGLAIGAIVLVKIALKTAFIASIFGATFGGISYAKTEYEMSISNIKQELAETTRQKGGQFIHEGLRFDQAYVDEENKTAIFVYTYPEVSNQVLKKAISNNPEAIEKIEREDFSYSVNHLKQEADFRTIFEHNWKVEYRYKTSDGIIAEDYVITRYDILN